MISAKKIISAKNCTGWRVDSEALAFTTQHPVHLVFLTLSEDQLTATGCASDLSPEEKRRIDRFVHTADRSRFIAGRTLLRKMLSHHLRLAEPLVPLTLESGRPVINPSAGLTARYPHFNLSHSGGVIALAWSMDRDLGIDVEECRPFKDMDHVAKRVMNNSEFSAYLSLQPADRIEAFFQLWVRKEAIMKQMKTGFSVEPKRISVSVDSTSFSNQAQASTGFFENKTFNLLSGRVRYGPEKILWSLSTETAIVPCDLEMQYVTAHSQCGV